MIFAVTSFDLAARIAFLLSPFSDCLDNTFCYDLTLNFLSVYLSVFVINLGGNAGYGTGPVIEIETEGVTTVALTTGHKVRHHPSFSLITLYHSWSLFVAHHSSIVYCSVFRKYLDIAFLNYFSSTQSFIEIL